jgi:outer membrane lipoprotein-sorting protein
MYSKLRAGFALAYILFSALSLTALAATPDEILRAADDIRNPSESFFMQVTVVGKNGNSAFEVYTKGKDKTLIKTVAPSRDVGRDLLMLQENMWAYIPNLKRAVRVSLNQKLSGQTANGDIARMRWFGDYSAKLEKETSDTWQLKMEANKNGLTYDRIRAFVKKNTFRPIRAEYLSKSDVLLKTAVFDGYKSMAGKMRPTIINITESKSSEVSTIEISKMESRDLPASLFFQDTLGKQ